MSATARALRVRQLSDRGLCECDGCHAVIALSQALVVFWHGQVALGRCDACADKHNVAIIGAPGGIEVRLEARRAIVLADRIPDPGPTALEATRR